MTFRYEEREQILLFNWIRRTPQIADHCWSTPNERKTTKYNGMRLKQMGLMPGAADITIAIPIEPYHGLYIELKYGKNTVTPLQKKFLENRRKMGYCAEAIWGYENARAFITNYLGDFLNDNRK